MKTLLAIALTILCWGVYGPTLHKGQMNMGHSELRPFICVGLAYFLIAVVVPSVYLQLRGEKGHWSATGIIWSLAAGAAGAIGALGIIFAFHFHGSPVFVMPLVFGGAPVVNSFLTIFMTRSFKQVGPLFLAGLILVITGAVTVLIFKPSGGAASSADWSSLPMVIASVILVMAGWGAYGPVLHKGQLHMAGSRMRPLICVGLAYFAIAVVVPGLLLTSMDTEASFTWTGSMWSLLAGAAGAVGALGIIMAFNFGGKPVYVMPLVFGGAPVVNAFVTMGMQSGLAAPRPMFYAGLIIVAVGAVVVLVFAPKTHAPATPATT